MSARLPYKDRNIVSRSFRLISDGIKDPMSALNQSDYDLYTSYFSTAIGDNKYVNPLPGFGFNTDPYPEPAVENKLGNEGRYYKRIYADNASSVTFTAGVAEFTGLLPFLLNMFDYNASTLANKGRSPGWAFYITQGISSIAFWPAQVITTSFNFLTYLTNTPKNRWYYCKPTMGAYFIAVQGIFNDLMVNAGYQLTVLPNDRQEQGNMKKGDRDYGTGPLKGYVKDSQIAKNNYEYMNSLFPDAINPDGTISALKICTRGVRKFRYFMKEIKNLDNTNIGTLRNKDIAIKGILEKLVKDGQFVNATGRFGGIGAEEYFQKELATVGKVRGPDEISYPEVASSYTNADIGNKVVPTSGDNQVNRAFNNGLNDIMGAASTDTSGSYGVDNNPGQKATGGTGQELNGNVPVNLNPAPDVNESSWLGQIGQLLMDGFYGGLDAVTFRTEGTGSVSDSFSNSTSQSELSSKFNSTVQAVNNFKFDVSGGSTGLGFVDDIVSVMKEAAAGFAAGSVIGNVPLALLGNSYVEIAEHWSDSNTNLHSESFSLYFEAPYAHPYSIATNIFLPLSLLMPFWTPFSTGGSMYTAPFLIKVFSRGKTIIRTGIVQNASLEFGIGPLGWTTDMKPLNMRVNITVADLDKVMSIPISRVTNPLDLLNVAKQSSRYLGDIGKYNDWTSRIAGIDYLDSVLRYNDANRRITRFSNDVTNMFKPETMAGIVNDSIIGDVARIFTSRPLNR